ncbi:MAG: SIMPL domain-containing protein [Nanoarchaeota archaeon]
MERNKLITIGVIVALVLVVAFLFAGDQPSVSAQGSSTIEAKPDRIKIYFVVETHNVSQGQSQLENTRITDNLVSALSIASENIKFSGFSSYPEYDYSNGNSRQIGFVTRQDVIVELDNFDEVSDIVERGIGAGAYVSTISLELSQEAQNENKIIALEQASKDARAKAEAQARGLGKKLGKLVSVSSQEFNYYPMPYYARAGDGALTSGEIADVKVAASSITPRDVEVSAQVSVVYSLKSF